VTLILIFLHSAFHIIKPVFFAHPISMLPLKTGRPDIAEILLKVALNTINQIKSLKKV
jgi:hypothetical protein